MGRKGAASLGTSTSLDMLATMTEHWRLSAVLRSRKPRCRRGTMRPSAAESTVCTNVREASLWMVSGTSSSFSMASVRAGMNGSISRLSTMVASDCTVSRAAALTSARRWNRLSETGGTRAATLLMSCARAVCFIWVRNSRHQTCTCHCGEVRPAVRAGIRPCWAAGCEMMRARRASSAGPETAATCLARSAVLSMISAAMEIR
mmetsp:Transcript_14411/g.33642  ORF Transcript_14411/g.33642 Transcript_14411/m.33642 type:complete len:204 (-) Transcript_14411:437-1048(-)